MAFTMIAALSLPVDLKADRGAVWRDRVLTEIVPSKLMQNRLSYTTNIWIGTSAPSGALWSNSEVIGRGLDAVSTPFSISCLKLSRSVP